MKAFGDDGVYNVVADEAFSTSEEEDPDDEEYIPAGVGVSVSLSGGSKRRKLVAVSSKIPSSLTPLRSLPSASSTQETSLPWIAPNVRELSARNIKTLLRSGLVLRLGTGAVATKLGQHLFEKKDKRSSSPDGLSFHNHKNLSVGMPMDIGRKSCLSRRPLIFFERTILK